MLKKVESLLRTVDKYLSNDDKILKTKVYEDTEKMDKDLIELLLSDKEIKESFFTQVGDTLVFDKQEFWWFLDSKEFLPDSYTSYKNKIGLTDINHNYLSRSQDVVLSFPYKDCFLEGGQSKDDQKREEKMYHEIIAKNEIRRMLSPKVLTKAKRYSKNGVEENITFNENDNLIMKGNNLIALSTLLKRYKGEVKCIYIDPPYNTGNDTFKYNDKFNHSTWLVFMKNRLELAKELLSDNGLIFVQCDDNEQAYLKVLMDDIFGKECFYGNLIQLKGNTQNDSKKIQKNHEYILCYSKGNLDLLATYKNSVKKEVFEGKYYLGRDTGASSGEDKLIERTNLGYTIYYYEGTGNGVTGNSNKLIDRTNLGYTIYYQEKQNQELFENKSLIDKNNVGYNEYKVFVKGDKIIHAIAISDYDPKKIRENSTEEDVYENDEYLISLGYVPIRPPKRDGNKLGRWTWKIEKFKEHWNKDEILIKNYKNVIKKEFVDVNDVQDINGKMYYVQENVLPIQSVVKIGNSQGTSHLKDLFGEKVFSNPKSEDLLQFIIESATSEGDIVLDFHLGSGTTAAVAHKMGRRYIGVEQMDYIENITVERLKKVIEGEKGGVSKIVNWEGGGSFVYCELKEDSNNLIKEIDSSTTDNIEKIKEKVYNDKRIIPYLTKQELQMADENFSELELSDKKKALKLLVDKNKLYVNYADINDQDNNLTEEEINFTISFYKGEN
ncbi:DNA methyltransferase [Mycoplasmopsis gallinacea]|uniref:Site-specific DNA-methyltransferase n=1 Tax=Mycoplasmopsis gallinacea TaxID=29556 RepID=A0A6H0V7D4_9BACT|nr:site-specific DNA-methyltransferase [Mycoplasmopsis gallinacea]QIW62405.1 site-specific DNA-methyltransferase [Mycoplasmopsis gallinacea]